MVEQKTVGGLPIVLALQKQDEDDLQHDAENKLNVLLVVFNSLFLKSERTLLQLSEGEPLYLPATNSEEMNKILFSHGFFSSALHEISHWLVAGKERRKLEDYGYWYKPDGRSLIEQQEFECVEVLPQAIEWTLSVVCRHPFHFSADNLNAGFQISDSFKQQVSAKAKSLLLEGYSLRMQRLIDALGQASPTIAPCAQDFELSKS